MEHEIIMHPIKALAAQYNILPNGGLEKRAAQSLLQHIAEVPNLTAEAAAELCAISLSSLRRLCRSLGYNSYSDFRQKVTLDLASYRYENTELAHLPGKSQASASLRLLQQTLQQLADILCVDRIDAIADALHTAQTVIFYDRMLSNTITYLQADLAVSGKRLITVQSFDELYAESQHRTHETLLLLTIRTHEQVQKFSPQVLESLQRNASVAVIVKEAEAAAFQNCTFLLQCPNADAKLLPIATEEIYGMLAFAYRERHLKDFIYYLK